MKLRAHSIRLRLSILTAMVVALIGSIIGGFGFLLLRSGIESELRAFALHEAEELSALVATYSEIEPLIADRLQLEPFSRETGVFSIGVLTWDGEPVLGFHRGKARLPDVWEEGVRMLHAGKTPSISRWDERGVPSLRSAMAVNGPGDRRWIVTTTVSRLAAEQSIVRSLYYYWGGLIGAVLLSFFGASSLVGRAIRPVVTMVADAQAIATDGPSRRLVIPPVGSELAELARLINQMLDRTEQTISRLRRFTANAGHELRTPLTRIRGEAEAALLSDSTERKTEALASVLEEADELRALVEALLEFAHGEDPSLVREPLLRLDELIEELGDEARELGQMRAIDVEVQIDDAPAWVHGNRLLLSRAIWNVISNALKFTPKGGRLGFHLQRAGDRILLDVTDSGPGLEDEDPEILFEPFYKRTPPGGGVPGHGLGLPLSRSIVRRHGGNWSASNRTEGGAKFRLSLPRGIPAADSKPSVETNARVREDGNDFTPQPPERPATRW